MNTFWSDCVQSIGTLYSSRSLRFADCFKEKYMNAFQIDGGKILEIGCGPGALAKALSRWYPKSDIIGTDRDAAFIEFAKNETGLNYIECDAAALPFEDESFDVTISNTVSEHIEPSAFYGEQYRVLKKGGVCLVLSTRHSISIEAPCISEESDFEKRVWGKLSANFGDTIKRNGIGAYAADEREMPLIMERYGFKNITLNYVAINLTPDDPRYPRDMAIAMINSNRQNTLDNIERFTRTAPGAANENEIAELILLTNRKYDKRIELYERGEKQWDTEVTLTLALRGEK